MDAAWVLRPDANKYIEAAYVAMRPDMGGRWFGFYTYGGVSVVQFIYCVLKMGLTHGLVPKKGS